MADNTEDIFREYRNIEGRLMLAELSAQTETGFKYEIWFDYTRDLIKKLKEGDIVGVANFSDDNAYSVLEITSVLPIHHALGRKTEDIKGYPGYIMEAAKNISMDWKEQVDEPQEDTTKIICSAIPTNLEVIDDPSRSISDKIIQEESAMPMPGEETKLLSQPMVKRIINLNINPEVENTIEIGSLLRAIEIKVLLRVDDLIKIHFGIFGFTGVGKSNLISTLITKLLSTEESMKVILFDLMDEYNGILVDQILRDDIDVNIVCIGEKTLDPPVFEYVNSNFAEDKKEYAVRTFIKTLLLPKGLRTSENLNKLKKITPDILKKIRIFEEKLTCQEFINEVRPELFTGSIGVPTKTDIEKGIRIVFGKHYNEELTPELANELLEKYFSSEALGPVTTQLTEATAKKRIGLLGDKLQKLIKEKIKISEDITVSLEDIVKGINKKDKNNLYIITSRSPSKLREFSKKLGDYVYWIRKNKGIILPLATFIFDEADEFIPLEHPSESQKKSKRVVEVLARRGRKFGLGVGISTQRSAYLDTKIMGQLHTYFISKLPRQYDRQAVGEAFGIGEDQFRQTFKFKSGEWLLVSHDAAGLSGIPIPIKAENAEKRIKEFLDKI